MNTNPLSRDDRRVGWLAMIALGGVLVGLVAGPVLAGALAPSPGYPAAAGATGDESPEHTIAVVGSGKVTVIPDQATIRLGVVLERANAKAARQAGAEAMTKVVAAIRKLGI